MIKPLNRTKQTERVAGKIEDAPRSALVLGECVQAPALVDMREVSPAPKSKNPKFYRGWTQEEKQPDFEPVCERWEGRQPGCPAPADQPHGAPENGGEPE